MRHPVYYPFAIIVMALYLLLPARALAHCATPDACNAGMQVVQAADVAPCGTCPCSDTQHGDCCEGACCCPCHAPFGQRITITYSPMVTFQRYPEIHGDFPLVYLSIFVPPQNRIA
jgi:hypothetical protein